MRMKFIILAFSAIWAGTMPAQDVVSNPKQAAAPDAGRVVELRLEDAVRPGGGEGSLSQPLGLGLAPDGTIVIQDGIRLVAYDPSGRFLKEIYASQSGHRVVSSSSSGGRPQIVQSGLSFIMDGATIACCDLAQSAVIVMETDGKIRKEIPLSQPVLGAKIVGIQGGRYLLVGRLRPTAGYGARPSMDPVLLSLSADGSDLKPIAAFSSSADQEEEASDGPVRYGRTLLGPLNVSIERGRAAYVNTTAEYLVRAVDLETGNVRRAFRREYDRVANTDPEPGTGASFGLGGNVVSPSQAKTKNDISGLFPRGDRLWVMTSSHDPEKGTLIDVFDSEGRYVDGFYLKAVVSGRAHFFVGTQAWMTPEAVYFAAKAPDGVWHIHRGVFPQSS